jgi:hypothetical protein
VAFAAKSLDNFRQRRVGFLRGVETRAVIKDLLLFLPLSENPLLSRSSKLFLYAQFRLSVVIPSDRRRLTIVRAISRHWPQTVHIRSFDGQFFRLKIQVRFALASATCLQKTGSETGFLAQNVDRLLYKDFLGRISDRKAEQVFKTETGF